MRYLAEQLTLKVTLLHSEPPIWRRVEVHSGLDLHDLHAIIQVAFAWQNSHLHHFIVTPGGKLTQKAMREAVYYKGPTPLGEFIDQGFDDPKTTDTLVGTLFTPDCKQILYEYDFGDGWLHVIKLEKRAVGGDMNHVPTCLAGENAPPFDDTGGMHGHKMWMEALADGRHPQHREAAAIYGKNYNPAHFDIDAINQALKAAFKPATPKRTVMKKRKKKGDA